MIDSNSIGNLLINPNFIEKNLFLLLKNVTSNLSNHTIFKYRNCLENCYEINELKEYLMNLIIINESNNPINQTFNQSNQFNQMNSMNSMNQLNSNNLSKLEYNHLNATMQATPTTHMASHFTAAATSRSRVVMSGTSFFSDPNIHNNNSKKKRVAAIATAEVPDWLLSQRGPTF